MPRVADMIGSQIAGGHGRKQRGSGHLETQKVVDQRKPALGKNDSLAGLLALGILAIMNAGENFPALQTLYVDGINAIGWHVRAIKLHCLLDPHVMFVSFPVPFVVFCAC